MLGPIGSQIMSIFRLLSPDEIDKYIVQEKADAYRTGEASAIAANGEGMAMTAEHASTMDSSSDSSQFPKDHQAKIIPLNKKVEEELQEQAEEDGFREASEDSSRGQNPQTRKQMVAPQSSQESNGELESMGILSSAKIKQIEAERLAEENNKKDSATVFLLKERERMRTAKKRLVEQIALKSYQTNAAQEFYEEIEEDLEEEFEEGSEDLKGILLNKRHY